MRNDWEATRQENVHPNATILTFTTTAPQCGDTLAILAAKQLAIAGGGGGTGVTSSPPSALAANYTSAAPYFFATTGAGSTPANLYNFSVMNAGSGAASFNGISLPAGMSVDFTAAPGTKFSSVSYNGSGNNIVIAGSQFV